MPTKPRLLFVITEDWYFVSHRLDLARAARDAGFEVGIATRVASCSEQIRNAGIHLFPLTIHASLKPKSVDRASSSQ